MDSSILTDTTLNLELEWDPEIDSPASIAIIGCGPVAIEAALYARFLGYGVFVYEAHRIASTFSTTPNRVLAHSKADACSTLGLAALEAQETPCSLESEQIVTHQDYFDSYLLPLARSDLLRDSISVHSPVRSVSRTCLDTSIEHLSTLKSELEFRLLIDSKKRGLYSQIVDIVLDCSGLSSKQGLASGGGTAVGEELLSSDIKGAYNALDEDCLAQLTSDQHLILWGDDQAAGEAVLQLTELQNHGSVGKVTWVMPRRLGRSSLRYAGLSEEQTTALEALRSTANPNLVCLEAWGIESISESGDSWKILCQTNDDETLELQADVFLNVADKKRDWSFWNGIPPVSHPMPSDMDSLCDVVSNEPHYYLLGSKAKLHLSMPEYRSQIRDLFAVIGGRRELDLYSTIQPQSS